MWVSASGCLGWTPASDSGSQPPTDADPQRQPWCLLPFTWETWIECPISGLGFSPSQDHCRHLGDKPADGSCVSLPLNQEGISATFADSKCTFRHPAYVVTGCRCRGSRQDDGLGGAVSGMKAPFQGSTATQYLPVPEGPSLHAGLPGCWNRRSYPVSSSSSFTVFRRCSI